MLFFYKTCYFYYTSFQMRIQARFSNFHCLCGQILSIINQVINFRYKKSRYTMAVSPVVHRHSIFSLFYHSMRNDQIYHSP